MSERRQGTERLPLWFLLLLVAVVVVAALPLSSLLAKGSAAEASAQRSLHLAGPRRAEPLAPADAYVDISIQPSSETVVVGESFSLQIYVDPNGQPVDTVDAEVTFDPDLLQVESVVGNSGGLATQLYSAYDNDAGTVTHSRGQLSGDPPTSGFTLCTITFQAVAATGGTDVVFTGSTNAYYAGPSVLGSTSKGTVTVEEPTSTPTVTPTPTATETPTPSNTPTPSSTPTATPTATETPTPSSTPTATDTPTPSNTPTPSDTPTATSTATETPTPSNTPTSTSTPTATPTATPLPGEVCLLAFEDLDGSLAPDPDEPLLAGAEIVVHSQAMVPLDTYTTDGVNEPHCVELQPGVYYVRETDPPDYVSLGPNWWAVHLLSDTTVTLYFADRQSGPTATPTTTLTPSSTPTSTPTGTPTHTGPPTLTPTPSHTPTHTPTATETPTGTSTATSTPSLTPSSTSTATTTATQTSTPTGTRTPTPSPSATPTRSPTATGTATTTATATATATPTATYTPTFSPTPTPTASPTSTLRPRLYLPLLLLSDPAGSSEGGHPAGHRLPFLPVLFRENPGDVWS